MAEYIEREALVSELSQGMVSTDDLYCIGLMTGIDHAIRTIFRQPAADVVEVKRGRWIVRDNRIVCSRCDAVLAETANGDVTEETLRDSVLVGSEKYCYNCGADMREEPT